MAFLAPLVPVMAVATTGIAAYSAVQQGRAASQAADYNAQVANQNATLQQQQAQQESAIQANQAQWLRYNQQVAQNQAISTQQQAENLRATTEENLNRRREDYRRILSRQKARFAKSGVAMTGTPVEVLAESAARMELEAQDIARDARIGIENLYYQAELQKAGAQSYGADAYMTQWQSRNALKVGAYKAGLTRSGAAMDQLSARNAQRASYLQAGSSLLSGASSAYYGGIQSGTFKNPARTTYS